MRTNQLGGWNPDILLLAPTQLLEQYHIIWAIVFVWLLFLGGASALMYPNRSDRQT